MPRIASPQGLAIVTQNHCKSIGRRSKKCSIEQPTRESYDHLQSSLRKSVDQAAFLRDAAPGLARRNPAWGLFC